MEPGLTKLSAGYPLYMEPRTLPLPRHPSSLVSPPVILSGVHYWGLLFNGIEIEIEPKRFFFGISLMI